LTNNSKKTRAHNTADEINFLETIGKHRNGKHGNYVTGERSKLLLNYYEAAKGRHDWGEIDRHEIFTYLVKNIPER